MIIEDENEAEKRLRGRRGLENDELKRIQWEGGFFHLVSFQEDSCSVNWRGREGAQPILHNYHQPWMESQSGKKGERAQRAWRVRKMRMWEKEMREGWRRGGERLQQSSPLNEALFAFHVSRKTGGELCFQGAWLVFGGTDGSKVIYSQTHPHLRPL